MNETVLFLIGMVVSIVAFCGSLSYAYVLLSGKGDQDRLDSVVPPAPENPSR